MIPIETVSYGLGYIIARSILAVVVVPILVYLFTVVGGIYYLLGMFYAECMTLILSTLESIAGTKREDRWVFLLIILVAISAFAVGANTSITTGAQWASLPIITLGPMVGLINKTKKIAPTRGRDFQQPPLKEKLVTDKVGGINEKFIKKEKEKTNREMVRDPGSSTERSNCPRDSKRNSQGNRQENLQLEDIADHEEKVFEKLADTFNAGLANVTRVKMLVYCLEKRSFKDMMLTLRLNPASLKHHQDLLQASGLIEKTGKGRDTRYRTTELGKTMLSFIEAIRKVVRAN